MISSMFLLKSVIFAIFVVELCSAVPKKYESQAESNYPENTWRRNLRDTNNDTGSDNSATSYERANGARLGYTTGYGGGLQGYGYSGSGVSTYAPLKIDLGGVVLGTLVGIGALLILPKLISAFGGGYGHYRSADSDSTGITDMLSKVDDFLAQNNVDSSSCVQKAVCSYLKSSEYHLNSGKADQIEQMVHSLADNSIVDYMLDGTAIKEAIENGKNLNGRDCDAIYPTCPLDRKSAIQMMRKFLPMGGQ